VDSCNQDRRYTRGFVIKISWIRDNVVMTQGVGSRRKAMKLIKNTNHDKVVETDVRSLGFKIRMFYVYLSVESVV